MRFIVGCMMTLLCINNAFSAPATSSSKTLHTLSEKIRAEKSVMLLTPFYEFDQHSLQYLNKQPGDIIKIEKISAPKGARAWRIMYVSRTHDDRLVPVTGIVVTPTGLPKHGTRSIVTWAHGTTGGARGCAPSLVTQPAQNLVQHQTLSDTPIDMGIPYLTDLLDRDYIVVATDYYGLGGPGVHQYLNGRTEARNTIDIVRAARKLPGIHADQQFVGFGWSQGGQAVLFLAEEQPQYAPELHLQGAATVAPASSLSDMVPFMLKTVPNSPFNFMTIRGMTDSYELSPSFLTNHGEKMVTLSGETCLDALGEIARLMRAPVVQMDPYKVPPWRAAFQLNDAGHRSIHAPILIVQGNDDRVVFPAQSKAYQKRACHMGAKVQLTFYQGANHRTMFTPAKTEILHWIDDRFTQQPAPSNCA